MLLAIDVGNTNTVLGVFNGDILEHSWRVKTDPRDTADELWLQYSSLVEGFDITGIAICSTVPAVLREVRKLVNDHYSDLKSVIIEPGVKTGVPLLVDNPVIDTVESNQFTVLAEWSIVAKDISSAPS